MLEEHFFFSFIKLKHSAYIIEPCVHTYDTQTKRKNVSVDLIKKYKIFVSQKKHSENTRYLLLRYICKFTSKRFHCTFKARTFLFVILFVCVYFAWLKKMFVSSAVCNKLWMILTNSLRCLCVFFLNKFSFQNKQGKFRSPIIVRQWF